MTGYWDSRRCPDCGWYIAHDLGCPQLNKGEKK